MKKKGWVKDKHPYPFFQTRFFTNNFLSYIFFQNKEDTENYVALKLNLPTSEESYFCIGMFTVRDYVSLMTRPRL